MSDPAAMPHGSGMRLAVIICTHNPRPEYLRETLDALRAQTLAASQWELILVDNACDSPLADWVDLSWHPTARCIREETLGLTPARIRGIAEAQATLLVLVDDDNVLEPDYLEQAVRIAEAQPGVGTFGGRIAPRFEVEPPEWTRPFWHMLAIRPEVEDRVTKHGENSLVIPCGAGMCVTRAVAQAWAALAATDPRRMGLDRRGTLLLSGGDTDLALTAHDMGLATGQFVALRMSHIIPARRLSESYLISLTEQMVYSTLQLEAIRGAAPPMIHGLRRWLTAAKGLLGGVRQYRFVRARQRGFLAAVRDVANATGAGGRSIPAESGPSAMTALGLGLDHGTGPTPLKR